MDTETLLLVSVMFTAAWHKAAKLRKARKRRRCPRWWVRPWIQDKTLRNQVNTAYKLQRQLALCDQDEFCRMLRMPPHVYEYLLGRLRPKIQKKNTHMRPSISPEERLSVTLKFLATGETSVSLSQNYRLGACSINRVIHETCAAIIDVLGKEFIKTPDTENEWKEVISQFWHRWNYPACIGCVDGKHVRIRKPPGSGSTYFNYKGFYSIVLMAVANGNYEFLYCNAGAEGSTADGGCWKLCDLPQAIEQGRLNLPQSVRIDDNTSIPCHFVADDAFAMSAKLLKPYPHRLLNQRERIFNYRLSRARRLIENVFGIITSRFQVLRTELRFSPDHCTNVVLAICVLHNVLRRTCGQSYIAPGTFDSEDINYNVIPGEWRNGEGLHGIRRAAARNPVRVAKEMRQNLTDFFLSDKGEVPWQYASTETSIDRTIREM